VGWYEHGQERVLGLLLRDRTDNDFGGYIFGKDKGSIIVVVMQRSRCAGPWSAYPLNPTPSIIKGMRPVRPWIFLHRLRR
jgi:hypothetical protein